ncbi:MAG: hypothetical protein ABH844_04970 [Candidatus Omnitrophota bacterium]
MKRCLSISYVILMFFLPARVMFADDGMVMGFPIGNEIEDADYDLCPQGVHIVELFIAAWYKQDYPAMYDFIDDESKQNYTFDSAKFEFQFLEFKPYKISSIKKEGENFGFFLSYGDWKDGDKDLKKILVSGKTFKIILFPGNLLFKTAI